MAWVAPVKRKLIVFGALLVACGIAEYFLHALSPRFSRIHAQKAIAQTLPPAIGDFRSVRRWNVPSSTGVTEAGASYLNPSGVEASVDIRLNNGGPHNGVACWLVEGYPMIWQRLITVRARSGTSTFDAALFRRKRGLALLANTECFAAGCTETRLPNSFGLRMESAPAPAISAVPVSIVVKDPSGLAPVTGGRESSQLVQRFRGFVAHLNLRGLFWTEPARQR